MKYVVLVPDGAADYVLDELGGLTPLQAAKTPRMDHLASEGVCGMVQVIPPSRPPGSDVGNLELFGYDTRTHYTGRAPLEAVSMGVELGDEDVAYRCNLITRDGDILSDYSAGHIDSEGARELVEGLSDQLAVHGVRFYPGVGYRHLMVFPSGPHDLVSYPPHDIMGRSITAHLPTGLGQEYIRALMAAAEPILSTAPVNMKRQAVGLQPANGIWLWGSGKALRLPSLTDRHDLRGGVISAVDLVRGIGIAAAMEIIKVPGITGYLDTNYSGKAVHALQALERLDLVYVHVEAPDEAGHNGDVAGKIQAIEDFDRYVVAGLLDGLSGLDACRVLIAPDHRTPIPLRTHSREPVPFVLWGKGVAGDAVQTYDEEACVCGSLQLQHGHHLMDHLLSNQPI